MSETNSANVFYLNELQKVKFAFAMYLTEVRDTIYKRRVENALKLALIHATRWAYHQPAKEQRGVKRQIVIIDTETDLTL